MTQTKANGVRSLLCVSLAGAGLGAGAFVVSLYFSLPPTDSAYGGGLWVAFFDPFVFTTALASALVVAGLALPFVIWALRHKNLRSATPIVVIAPAIAIAVLTPRYEL